MTEAGKPMKADEMVRALLDRFASPDENVRRSAMAELESIDDPLAARALLEYQGHPDNLVRYSVKKALATIKNRLGDKFEGQITAAGENDEAKRSGPGNAPFAAICFLVVAVYFAASFYILRNIGGGTTADVPDAPAAAAKGGKQRFNVVRFVGGKPMIRTRGLASSVDRIRREAVFLIGDHGEKCVAAFPDGVQMDVSAGGVYEIEGEIVRNDNVSPPLIECRKVAKAGTN